MARPLLLRPPNCNPMNVAFEKKEGNENDEYCGVAGTLA